LPEQKRDIKLSDEERTRLNEVKKLVFNQINYSKETSPGFHIAKIVLQLEPLWCQWKEEKAPGFEKPPSQAIRAKITEACKKDFPLFTNADYSRRRVMK